jgi:hypothetical protein
MKDMRIFVGKLSEETLSGGLCLQVMIILKWFIETLSQMGIRFISFGGRSQ